MNYFKNHQGYWLRPFYFLEVSTALSFFTSPLPQARSQVARFGGSKYILRGGKVFVFIIRLKQIFLGTINFGGGTPRMPPVWLRACLPVPQPLLQRLIIKLIRRWKHHLQNHWFRRHSIDLATPGCFLRKKISAVFFVEQHFLSEDNSVRFNRSQFNYTLIQVGSEVDENKRDHQVWLRSLKVKVKSARDDFLCTKLNRR